MNAATGRHADLLVRGGTVITPNGIERIDVACVNGRIVALGDLQSAWHTDTTLDATGLHVCCRASSTARCISANRA